MLLSSRTIRVIFVQAEPMQHEKKGWHHMWVVRVGCKEGGKRKINSKNLGCSKLLLVNLVESRRPIGWVVSKNASRKKGPKWHVVGQGANKEKQVQECWMQQALIGQSGRIKASYWPSLGWKSRCAAVVGDVRTIRSQTPDSQDVSSIAAMQ